DTDEFFHLAVPGCNLFIGDRPGNAVPVLGIGFEILLAETVCLSSPQERASADDICSCPDKRVVFVKDVGVIPVIVPEMAVGLPERVTLALNEILLFVKATVGSAMKRQFPAGC